MSNKEQKRNHRLDNIRAIAIIMNTLKKKNIATIIRDKIKRLIIPFLAFGLLWLFPVRMILAYPGYENAGQLTELSENTALYFNKNVSLKFSDDKALGYYILNGTKSPTGLNGIWGDGNFQNISRYLNMGNGEDGRNELTVYDKAGNVKEFVFYIDQTAPVITDVSYSPSNGDFSLSKTVTITVDEASEYGKDWELPEGYEFAEEFDENTAKQSFTVKCGQTLEIPEIGIVPVK